MAEASIVPAPRGTGDDKNVTFSKAGAATIQVRAETDFGYPASTDDGQPIYEMIPAPSGSHALYSAPRMCGDWYAEFTAGRRISSAIGATQVEAVREAAARLPA